MAKEKESKKKSSFDFRVVAVIFLVIDIVLLAVIYSLAVGSNWTGNVGNNSDILEEDSLSNQIEINSERMGNSIAVLETNYGVIKIELFEEQSPVTAGNFRKLVEEGFYDGTRFHRVIDNFMIQGGDPLSKDDSKKNLWGTGDPGYAIEDEFIYGLSNLKGTISMANSGPNTGGSQFFINLVDNTYLDWDKAPQTSKHPVFGEVVEGFDVVEKIGKVSVEARSNRPTSDVVIEKAYIE